MNKRKLYFVSGFKGGIGKSMLASFVLSYLLRHQIPVKGIDTDQTNPDMVAAYGQDLVSLAYVEDRSGWLTFLDCVNSEQKDTNFVVNTPAGSVSALKDNIQIFRKGAQRLGFEIVVLWPMIPSRDCQTLLSNALDIFSEPLHIGLNLHMVEGKSEYAFDDIIESSAFRENLERGGSYFFMPNMIDRIKGRVIDARVPLHLAKEKLDIVDSIEFEDWEEKFDSQLLKVIQ